MASDDDRQQGPKSPLGHTGPESAAGRDAGGGGDLLAVGAIASAVLEAAVDAIIVIDPHGTMQAVNDSASQLFGWRRSEMVGNDVNMLMPEPFHSDHGEYLRRYLDGGPARIIGRGREVIARRADGSVFPIFLSVSEVKAGDQHLFAGIVHDLSERNQQRAELEMAKQRLEDRVVERTRELDELLGELRRSNQDLDQFASVASHDLKTPLRNVRQSLELLDEHLVNELGVTLDDEARELRQFSVDAVTRMEDLIDGLLAYARLQADRAVEPVDLNVAVADVVDALRMDLDDIDATVDVARLPLIRGHQTQLRQLFHNLVANAIRYRSDDRLLQIEVAATMSDGVATVSVVDNGRGIDPSQHERIFGLFRQAETTGDGVGLGLAICRRIVEAHDGRIWVDSAPGQGATFVFTLPLADG